jgi:hypothetical protein
LSVPQIQPNQKWQLTRGNGAASDRVLLNSFFANKPAAGDPAARRLARSTFHGRFFDRDGRHHHRRAIVIDWAGRRTLFCAIRGNGLITPYSAGISESVFPVRRSRTNRSETHSLNLSM